MRQIPPMRRITIILNIPSLRRIRQAVFLRLRIDNSLPLHPRRRSPHLRKLVQLLGATGTVPRGREERVRFAVEDAADGRGRVVACCDGAAGGFDGGDGGGGGARGDDVNGLFKGFAAVAEDLEAVDGSAGAFAVVELFHCYWAVGVDAALVDPVLEAVEVDGCHFDGEAGLDGSGLGFLCIWVLDFGFWGLENLHVDTAAFTVNDDIFRLTAIEAGRDLAVLALTFVTATGGLTLS
jgi:hypothetical protein